jgi:hypothetical protein
VTDAEEAFTAVTLADHRLLASLDAALAFVVAVHDDGLVGKVDDEVLVLGDAVLAGADLMPVIEEDTVQGAEVAAAVDTHADRLETAGHQTSLQNAFVSHAFIVA